MSPVDHRPRVLHVYLDERGGGPVHVGLLRAALGDAVRWEELGVDPGRVKGFPAGWIRVWRQIAACIGREPTLVHAHGIRAAAAALLPARRRGMPLVITIHGLHSLRRSRAIPAMAAWIVNRIVLGSADRVLVLGEADRRLILDKRLASRRKIQRIHAVHGSRPLPSRREARRLLGLPGTAQVVLWLGRLVDGPKDPLTFLRAVEQLGGDHRIALIVGEGPLLHELRTRARAAGLDGRVRFTGWMEDPAPALAASDVFVSTSRWEGLPVAGLEAAAAGLPLLLADCPGNRDLVDAGVPAVLFRPGDAHAVAHELDVLLGDSPMRKRLGRRSRSAVGRAFRPELLRHDVLTAYRGVLAARRPHRGEVEASDRRPFAPL